MTENESMVLRSIHLPPRIDEQLRTYAFFLRCSKADLMRLFVAEGLNEMRKRLGDDPDQATVRAVLGRIEAMSPSKSPSGRSQVELRPLREAIRSMAIAFSDAPHE